MAGLNRVMLVGHLGRDPELRTIDGGTVKVATFPLATHETYYDKGGEKQDLTEWHNIVLWRNLADRAERVLSKGKLVFVEGKLKTRSYVSSKDNAKKYVTEIVVSDFKLLGRKKDFDRGDNNNGNNGNNNNEDFATETESDSDSFDDILSSI